MSRSCVRVVLLGLLAAVSATGQVALDLTGRPVDFDLVTLAVQTQIEAVTPVVISFANAELSSLGNAWVDKYHKAVLTGTMTVQQNADDLNDFLTGAAELSPNYANNIKAAIAKSRMEFFKFHAFMPAATWDVIEYGIAQSKSKFNANRLMQTRTLMVASVNSAQIQNLQLALNTYFNNEEKTNPGFIKAVGKTIEVTFKTVLANNPTRKPTAPPATKTPTATTVKPTARPATGTSAAATGAVTMTAPPTIAPDLSIGDSFSLEDSALEPASTPASASTPTAVAATPTPTSTSSASEATTTGVVATMLVLAAAGTLS